MFLAWTSVAAERIVWTICCPDLFLAFWIDCRADLLSHRIVVVVGSLYASVGRW